MCYVLVAGWCLSGADGDVCDAHTAREMFDVRDGEDHSDDDDCDLVATVDVVVVIV